MNQNAKTRRRVTGGHREIEVLGGGFNPDNSPEIENRQRDFVARRLGITPHLATAIASLVFERGAAR